MLCHPQTVPVLGTFHVTLTDIYLEGLDVEEAKTGLVLGPDGIFVLLVENLQVLFKTSPLWNSRWRNAVIREGTYRMPTSTPAFPNPASSIALL